MLSCLSCAFANTAWTEVYAAPVYSIEFANVVLLKCQVQSSSLSEQMSAKVSSSSKSDNIQLFLSRRCFFSLGTGSN